MTYSILARDPDTGELGGAVQSHFFAVGRRCLTLRPGVGAVASQAMGSAAHGPRGLHLLETAGTPAAEMVERILGEDDNRDLRQVIAVDTAGRTGGHVGSACMPVAGMAVGDGVIAAGNTCAPGVWDAMVERFSASRGQLSERLVEALRAGQERGGDRRGMMSAALKVVGPDRTEFEQDGTVVDIRVDFDVAPIEELGKLLSLAQGHARLVRAVLSPGRLVGHGREAIDNDNVAQILTELSHAQEQLDGTWEPTFWAAMVALQTGQPGAVELLKPVLKHEPQYASLALDLVHTGRIQTSAEAVRAAIEAAQEGWS